MPRRTDISALFVTRADTVIIGHAAERDYSGTQTVRRSMGL